MYNAKTSLNRVIYNPYDNTGTVSYYMEQDTGLTAGCLFVLYERSTHHEYPQLRVTHVTEGTWDRGRNQHFNRIQFEISTREQDSALATKLMQSFYRRLFLTDKISPPHRVFLERKDYESSLTAPVKIDTMELYLAPQDGWFNAGDQDESVRRFIATMNLYYNLGD